MSLIVAASRGRKRARRCEARQARQAWIVTTPAAFVAVTLLCAFSDPAIASPTGLQAAVATVGSRVSAAPPLVVAIDPGHGGSNLGAPGLGHGLYEKKVTLALGERVRALLAQPGADGQSIAVVLCRDRDELVPIRARARCAHDSGARLFLSLHANAVPVGVPSGSQRGFEIFVLGPREVEDDAALAAVAERDDVDAVWAAHEVRAAAEQSIVLALAVSDQLTQALGVDARRGIKQAGAALDVLRGAGTPAALVEVGFLDHPDDGARLASADGREPIARALASAIRLYLTAAPGPTGRTRP